MPDAPAQLARVDDVRDRDVWLVHPWALRDAPGDLPGEAVHLSICETAFHAEWPWSEARWSFVGARMRAMAPVHWHDSSAAIAAALRSARSVRSVDDPHLGAEIRRLIAPEPARRLFADVERPCTSFSAWWKRAS